MKFEKEMLNNGSAEVCDRLSVLDKVWSQKPYDEGLVYDLVNACGVDELMARILVQRGVGIDDVELFLNPKLRDLMPSPFVFKEMREACDRVCRAVVEKQNVVIFADYDVDGATSGSLVKRCLDSLSVPNTIYIPDRITDGYGPSSVLMQKFYDDGVKLVITLDCGTVAFEPLKYAKNLGLDVVVIDHHITGHSMPEAYAIVNPNRLDVLEGDGYLDNQYGYLAAVGVAFIFISGIYNVLKNDYSVNTDELPNLMSYLDIVALGTVCDVVPLIGLNRAYVVQGLKVMQKRHNLGLKALSDIAGVSNTPTTYDLGFLIGPRINAGGRVGQSDIGAKLLATNDWQEAMSYANLLEKYNLDRREIEQRALVEAMDQAEMKNESNKCIIVYDESWHQGVIGILASRIKDRFNKLVIVIAMLDDKHCKGSCRSVTGVNAGALIAQAKDLGLVVDGGGHAMAAGFTVEVGRIPEIEEFFNKAILDDQHDIRNNAEYDISLSIDACTHNTLNKLKNLGPFGQSNQEPIIKISNILLSKVYVSGNTIMCLLQDANFRKGDSSGHFSALSSLKPLWQSGDNSSRYRDDGITHHSAQHDGPNMVRYAKTLKCVAFNKGGTKLGDLLMSFTEDGNKNSHKSVTVFGYLKINEWYQKPTLQFTMLDAIIEE